MDGETLEVRKPLSLQRIAELLVEVGADPDAPGDWHLAFVRAVEREHGITESQ